MPTRKGGSFKIFRLFGIDVYIHWAWFLAFVYLTSRPREYSSTTVGMLNVLEYLLFLIVLIA